MHCCTLPYLDEIIPSLLRWDYLISAQQNLFVPSGLLERAKRYWNALRAIGTAAGSTWNARSATGTPLRAIGTALSPGQATPSVIPPPLLIDRLHTYCRLNVDACILCEKSTSKLPSDNGAHFCETYFFSLSD